MKRKLLSLAVFVYTAASMAPAQAQFNTVVDKRGDAYEYIPQKVMKIHNVDLEIDTLTILPIVPIDTLQTFPLSVRCRKSSKKPVRKKHLALFKTYKGMPDLTINNLLYEIRRNGIQHEKVVLAQAILETGWFTSSVCRNKNNLFGLINPRTGQFYEFDHWTESVRAYYTKVQYRYKGGNYLLWLDEIGYAEKRTYIEALIRLLNQYFI